ncbi:MAG: hypothetical protein ACR2N0_18140 [Rubrobacteraceae bacterium]
MNEHGGTITTPSGHLEPETSVIELIGIVPRTTEARDIEGTTSYAIIAKERNAFEVVILCLLFRGRKKDQQRVVEITQATKIQ